MHRFVAIGIALLALTTSAGMQDSADDRARALFSQLKGQAANLLYLDELRGIIPRITDPDLKARAMTAYGLGRLLAGEPESAEAVRQQLEQHYADTPYPRLFNASVLMRTCPWCSGDTKRGAVCEHCHGTGKCPVCKGRGKLERLNKALSTCPECNGTGKCRVCGGRRRNGGVCAHCHGTGSVLNARKVRLLLHSVVAYRPLDEADDTPDGRNSGE